MPVALVPGSPEKAAPDGEASDAPLTRIAVGGLAAVPPGLAALPKTLVPTLPVTQPASARAVRPEPGLPRLSLEAISVVNGRPVAVINKQKLVPGETISGARVIRILDYQVELEYQGRRFAIGL